jgi:hypothetical protein
LVKRCHHTVPPGVKDPPRAVAPIIKYVHPRGSEFEELIGEKLGFFRCPGHPRNVPHVENRIRREELTQSVDLGKPLVDFDPCIEPLPHQFDVLLRHSPRSIPLS